ncbi:hypothetical protein [Acetobacter okinawensis]|uniref:hypothetical protein n=1 Tax=Acetobacter okinawensis TaxID=1076594 RepID=UPI000A3B1014|nr:hypothetical protein [Acetobacter okinawensis]
MMRPVFHFARKAPFFAAMAGLAALAGCQSAPYQLRVEQTPSTLLYSYAIANGMARGQLMSGTMTLPQIVNIVTADRAALGAILLFRDHPNNSTLIVAGQKVEDFLATLDQPDTPGRSVVMLPAGASSPPTGR